MPCPCVVISIMNATMMSLGVAWRFATIVFIMATVVCGVGCGLCVFERLTASIASFICMLSIGVSGAQLILEVHSDVGDCVGHE